MAARKKTTKKTAPKPAAKRPSKKKGANTPARRPSRPAATTTSAPDDTAITPEVKATLNDLRDKIDGVDQRLIKLLNQRAKHVVKVGALKRAAGVPIYTPHREQEVLKKVSGLNTGQGGPLPDRTIEAIYRELMSGSFALEHPLRIGYLGPVGSYSHLAAVKHFGSSVAFEDLRAIEGVFTEVARGHVDYGLVPIENSTGGGIVESLDAFLKYHDDVGIYAEVQLEVHHALLAACEPSQITKIYSKPEVFQQCRVWLSTQFPRAELIPAASSARAVRTVADATDTKANSKNSTGMAAIGSTLAGEIHGLHPIFENIEDEPNNITRFFVISRQKTEPSGSDKTSIMFTTDDKPGALVAVLAVLERAGINLSHIDKRPSGRVNWAYTFFIDAEGHIDDPWFAAAIRQVEGHCRELVVLGSYPRSKRIL